MGNLVKNKLLSGPLYKGKSLYLMVEMEVTTELFVGILKKMPPKGPEHLNTFSTTCRQHGPTAQRDGTAILPLGANAHAMEKAR